MFLKISQCIVGVSICTVFYKRYLSLLHYLHLLVTFKILTLLAHTQNILTGLNRIVPFDNIFQIKSNISYVTAYPIQILSVVQV